MMPGVRIAVSDIRCPEIHDHRSFGGVIQISEKVLISDGVILATWGIIEIGAHVYIGPYCFVYRHGG
jgi:hypothetical protein